jgi:hypothetical protein
MVSHAMDVFYFCRIRGNLEALCPLPLVLTVKKRTIAGRVLHKLNVN